MGSCPDTDIDPWFCTLLFKGKRRSNRKSNYILNSQDLGKLISHAIRPFCFKFKNFTEAVKYLINV